jgi:hypothetical protein
MKKGGIFYGHLEYFTVLWYIFGHLVMLRKFGAFSLALVYCGKKNLAAGDGEFQIPVILSSVKPAFRAAAAAAMWNKSWIGNDLFANTMDIFFGRREHFSAVLTARLARPEENIIKGIVSSIQNVPMYS